MSIYSGRTQVPFYYSCYGYTRGGGKTWHGGIDVVGVDDTTIRMPDYDGKSISGTVVSSRIVDKSTGDLTWEWGWYVCVQLDANQTPDTVNYLYFCHNERNLVTVGQKVKTGDALAIMGNSGNAALANPPIKHCHFEVRATRSGKGLDPTHYSGTKNAVGTYDSSNSNSDSGNTNVLYNGIDVSKYQGVINWPQVKAAGYKFAFIRVGYCGYDGRIIDGYDPYYETNMKNAIAAGIDVGVYVYSYAKTVEAAKIAAQDVINRVKPYTVTMPIAFDFEDSSLYSTIGKAANTEICKAFLSEVQRLGYYSMLYTYTNFANTLLDMSQLSAYDMWLADYTGSPGYSGSYSIWQYSSKGSVAGISGNCDVNYEYKDHPAIIRAAGLNGLGEQTVEKLTNTLLRVSMVGEKNPNQYFNSKDTNDIVGYLDIGDYEAIEKNSALENGFWWVKFKHTDGKEYWAVYDNHDGGAISDGRAVLVAGSIKPDHEPEPEPTPPASELVKQIEELMKQLEDLMKQVDDALAKANALEEENKRLVAENEQLKAKIEAAKAALA